MQKTADLADLAFKEIEALQLHSAQAMKRAGCFAEGAIRRNPVATDEIHDQCRRYLLTMQRIVTTANAHILAIVKEGL
jgi:hypothetical protein